MNFLEERLKNLHVVFWKNSKKQITDFWCDDPRCGAGIQRELWHLNGINWKKCRFELASKVSALFQNIFFPQTENQKEKMNAFHANLTSKSIFRWWRGFRRVSQNYLVSLVRLGKRHWSQLLHFFDVNNEIVWKIQTVTNPPTVKQI